MSELSCSHADLVMNVVHLPAVPGTIHGVLVNESLKNTHANPIGDDDNVDMALKGN